MESASDVTDYKNLIEMFKNENIDSLLSKEDPINEEVVN